MRIKKLAKQAIIMEAEQHPDEKFISPEITLSYEEIAKRLKKGGPLAERSLIENLVVQPYIKMLEENPEFRKKVKQALEG